MAVYGCETPTAQGERVMREAGYTARARGGRVGEGDHPDEKQDKKLIRSMVDKAKIRLKRGGEAHPIDPGDKQKEEMKFRAGGKVSGKKVDARPDRKRRADGGGMGEDMPMRGPEPMGGKRPGAGGKGGAKGKIGAVNIIIGKGDDDAGKMMAEKAGEQKGVQIGAQMGARAAAAKMAGGAATPAMPSPGAAPGGPPGGPPRPPMGPPPGAGAPPMQPPMGTKRGGAIKVREHERRRAGGGI